MQCSKQFNYVNTGPSEKSSLSTPCFQTTLTPYKYKQSTYPKP
ncbi:hypothetical protein NEIMUCOT_05708 [Neisseria mucosa ATCC 25996]|uniref:Uncharacterized protein n=1 Tax=Neisseria mucosa (strain ATCC 25996 / DSM 4631 / NCTC 10774 / M26) TaxID=546266 RepID=D2ZYJ7_NEIM2|nr:hypothetical protein NEIMUCOT_05708 [Neisseria mucosa ATCC 25996]